jgi:hypothetical protein
MITDDVATLLEADGGAGGVATLLTGGIYTYEETKRLGISRDNTPSAFNTTTGLLKPCCIVKARAQTADGGISDDPEQSVSYVQVLELWFYDDGDAGFSTIEAARDRAFVVLHGQTVGASNLIPRWVGNPIIDARDAQLDYAAMLRTDYNVNGLV